MNESLLRIIENCIKNSPDSEVKRREVEKLKKMFSVSDHKKMGTFRD